MNTALWIVSGLIAVALLGSGAAKLLLTKEKLATTPGGGWVEGFGAGAIKAIGTLEVAAAAGLVLPAALDIAPVLVPLAAVGVALLMVGAMITHLRRHENKIIIANLVYLALAVFVALGRT